MLPNTNKREALELAERLKDNICQRTNRIPELSEGVPITIAVGQCTKDDTASDFIKRLEHLIQAGKVSPHAPHAEILTLE
jgi:GGDEF domain-containing protein